MIIWDSYFIQIGPDLGLALAKGVVLSLVTVFTFMPALTLACYKWMDKTHHRPLLPGFDKFGRFVARIMLPMALVLVILMVPSYLASNSNQPHSHCSRSSWWGHWFSSTPPPAPAQVARHAPES